MPQQPEVWAVRQRLRGWPTALINWSVAAMRERGHVFADIMPEGVSAAPHVRCIECDRAFDVQWRIRQGMRSDVCEP